MPIKPLNQHNGIRTRITKVTAGRITVNPKEIKLTEESKEPKNYYICNLHIEDVATLNTTQASNLLKIEGFQLNSLVDGSMLPIKVVLTYPFSKQCILAIKPACRKLIEIHTNETYAIRYEFTVGYILNVVAKQYKKIYEKHAEEYGIWGHELADLDFEAVSFDPQTRQFQVGIGS